MRSSDTDDPRRDDSRKADLGARLRQIEAELAVVATKLKAAVAASERGDDVARQGLGSERGDSVTLNAALAEAEAKAQAALAVLEAHRAVSAMREKSLAALLAQRDRKLAAALDETQAMRQQLRDGAHELVSVRTSTSWRLTAPVRWVGTALRAFLLAVKAVVRPVLAAGLALVRRSPGLKRFALKVASVAPPVKRRLIEFGRVRPPVGETEGAFDAIASKVRAQSAGRGPG